MRAFVPSITNSGQIRSSVVRTCSRTMRRAHSLRRFRRMRIVRRSSCSSVRRGARFDRREPGAAFDWAAEFDRHERLLPAIYLAGLGRSRYLPARIRS